MSQPNFKQLQDDVIDLLKEVSTLMDRASKDMSTDKADNDNKYTKFQQQVKEEVNKVDNLQLRMAIVAPMKAGKSTIVNAIAGLEILPSRNSAMTTLPTEVIFDPKAKQPTLILSLQIVEVFQETLSVLRDKINKQGIEEVKKVISQYPHLANIPEKIKDSQELKITSETQGRENIIEKLAGLNDIIRLCNILAPQADPLLSLKDVPQIKTPLPHFQKNPQTDRLGNLVIVDTPGPNEAGENLKLKGVVEEQLTKSSIVLIVLDFTQLKTEAAEKVRQDVNKVIEIRGRDNLYVLVNKVDQRRKGDMTTEQVQQFVDAEFHIGGSRDINRVFEISARRAFTSANFLIESYEGSISSVTKMKTAQALAEEVFGIDWEEDIEKATLEELKDKAQKLLNKSGFNSFIDGAINALIAEAAPRCMKSALKITSSLLGELKGDIEFRKKAIDQEEGKLKEEIEAFEKDLQELEKFHHHLQEVERIKKDLFDKLNQQIDDIKRKAKDSIKKGFAEEAEKGKNSLDIIAEKFRSFISFNKKNSDILEFQEKYAAQLFAEQAIASTKRVVEPLLETELKKVESSIENKRRDLTNSLKKKIQPLIQQARQRLKGLDLPVITIELLLPMPTLDTGEIEITPDIKQQTRTQDGGYETKVVRKRKFQHWLWIVPKEETIRVKRPDINENYYTVSRQEIVEKSNQYIENSIENIKQRVEKYIDDEFKQEVTKFFEELDSQLSNISKQLKSAQQAQKLEAQEREKLVAKINSLLPEVNKKSESARQLLSRVNKEG